MKNKILQFLLHFLLSMYCMYLLYENNFLFPFFPISLSIIFNDIFLLETCQGMSIFVLTRSAKCYNLYVLELNILINNLDVR